MGLIAECDGGCGATTKDIATFKEFGVAKRVWYCDDCQQNLQDLYDMRDSLHTHFARELESRLLLQISEFKKGLPGGRLPDAAQ